VEELREVIAMLKRPEFKPLEIDDDLHQRIAGAVHSRYIKKFDMRESSRDGDQDLTMFMREVEDVVREIMEDPRFKGHQHYRFEAELDENGERLFGGEASAGVSFQIGQIRYIYFIYQIMYVYTLYMICIYDQYV
jgi:hypothetical protein